MKYGILLNKILEKSSCGCFDAPGACKVIRRWLKESFERDGYSFLCWHSDEYAAGWIPRLASRRTVLVPITSCRLSWFIVFSLPTLMTQPHGCTFRRLPQPPQWRRQAFLFTNSSKLYLSGNPLLSWNTSVDQSL